MASKRCTSRRNCLCIYHNELNETISFNFNSLINVSFSTTFFILNDIEMLLYYKHTSVAAIGSRD